LLEPDQEGRGSILALRCCVHAQKRPRPSWLVSVLRLRFSCSGPVVVSLVTNLTLCKRPLSTPLCCRRAPAQCRARSRVAIHLDPDRGRLILSLSTPLQRGTQRHVDGRRGTTCEPRSVFVTRRTPPRSSRLPRDDSARAAAAFDAFRRSSNGTFRRQRDDTR
jgi:hypothetical protein